MKIVVKWVLIIATLQFVAWSVVATLKENELSFLTWGTVVVGSALLAGLLVSSVRAESLQKKAEVLITLEVSVANAAVGAAAVRIFANYGEHFFTVLLALVDVAVLLAIASVFIKSSLQIANAVSWETT